MKEDNLEIMDDKEFETLYYKSKTLINNARNSMGKMANTITVITSFMLGQYIVEQEQHGKERAKYGAKVIDSLSKYLTKEFGRGFSRSNIAGMRQFYKTFRDREKEIVQLGIGQFKKVNENFQLSIGQLEMMNEKNPFKLSGHIIKY